MGKPEPLPSTIDTCDVISDDETDPFDVPCEDKSDEKILRRVTWRSRFKDLFIESSIGLKKKKKKKNPKRFSRQTSSFYEKCRSVGLAFIGKTSTVKVFTTEEEETSSRRITCT